ncbi:S-layer homology domain-containing protein [Tissierella sp. Yu-01]|uniref:S-layer homology domain-containing protein n=1 Tax=Tissierella sp. Yu-01 TaxID=3035694 RepID=UPI00240E7523|nr:S-layer homology domain-containing protein [Tissierella sp. Yu-01]WFA09680.1 S-layer homology domain-containing protein [Tissierella sp. Yu-01]
MKMTNRILTFIITLILILNAGVAFAASDFDSSYTAGYDAGFEAADEYEPGEYEVDDAYSEFRRSSEYNKIKEKLGVEFDRNDFKDGFYDGFEDGIEENDKEEKVNYAVTLGRSLGYIYGARDFQNNDKSDWKDAIPSDREIRRMYDLNMHDADYRETFIDAFEIAFMEGYLDSYEKAQFDPAKITQEQGLADGEALGTLLGAAYGAKDYYEGKNLDYTRNLPSDRVITAEYLLNNDLDEYKAGFLSGFIRAYEEAYNKAYRESNINDTLRNEGSAYSDGKAIGNNAGQMQATQDFMSRLPNDWRKSLPTDRFIISEFGLIYQSSDYREAFISGYYDGFSEGYNSRYKELSQGVGMEKLISEIVPISGGSITSLDNVFNVTIEPGTYYHDVNLSVNTTYDVGNYVTSSLIKASDSYTVNILNTSGNLNDEKLITISFEYYGDKLKGGIYKLVDGIWTYVPTVIENGSMTAYIKPSSIKAVENTYSAFMDTKAIVFPDSRGHWANSEINTYVRRNIINGYSDMTFKPERNISRAEFLTLLSRVYNWNLPLYTANTSQFRDYNIFGNFNNTISYALSNNYIMGYGDGTFKPNDPISYNEIEIIMNRVLGTNTFKWSNIAYDILYNKKYRPSSFDNMNNKITRAEVVYMLYTTTEP